MEKIHGEMKENEEKETRELQRSCFTLFQERMELGICKVWLSVVKCGGGDPLKEYTKFPFIGANSLSTKSFCVKH